MVKLLWKPGNTVPISGLYQKLDATGSPIEHDQATCTKGEPFPPTGAGGGWQLAKQTPHRSDRDVVRQIPVLGMGSIDIIRTASNEYLAEFCGQTPSRRGAAERYPNAQTAADQGVLFAKRLLVRAIDSLNA